MPSQLNSIALYNFKSFVQRWDLTPLMLWNSIMGPNGSGKSCLIEAITFALGENDMSQLRIDDLSELISRPGPHDSATYVRLTFICETETTVFERSLEDSSDSQQYESRYKINEEIVQLPEYLQRLEALGINIKAKDFLVYQGKINDIIDASPQDRSRMLEIASGSIVFKERYDQLTQNINAVHENIVTETAEKRKLNTEIRKCKNAVEKSKDLELLREQFQKSKAVSYLLKLRIIDLKDEKLGPDVPLENSSSRIDEVKKNTQLIERSVQTIEKKHGKMTEESQKLEKLKAERRKKENQQSDCEMEIKKLEEWIEEEKKLQETIANVKEMIRENEKLLQKYSQELRGQDDARIAECEEDYKQLQNEVQQQMGSSLAMNESKIRQKHKINAELDLLNQKLLSLEKSILNHQASINKNKQSMENYRQDREKVQDDAMDLQEELQTKLELLIPEKELESLQNHKRQIEERLELCRVSSDSKKEKGKQTHILEKLKQKFPEAVYDRIRNICEIPTDKYRIAMAATLDKDLNTIIVKDDATAAECMKYLYHEQLGLETFYSMESVSSPSLDRDILSKLNSPRAKLVYDLVRCDAQYEPVIKAIVRSTILCETLGDAWRAMDRMQTLKRKHNIVTLAGEFLTTSYAVYAGFNQRKIQGETIRTVDEGQLEEEKQQIVEKLRRARDGRLKFDVQRLETEYQFKLRCLDNLKAFLNKTETKTAALQAVLQDLQEQQRVTEEKKLEVEKRKEEFIVEGELFHQKTDKLRKSVFKNFCARLGIKQIEEFEAMLVSRNERITQKKNIENRISELRTLEKYDESRSKAKESSKWENKLKDLQKKLNDIQLDLSIFDEEIKQCNLSLTDITTILEKENAIIYRAEEKRRELMNFDYQKTRKSSQIARLRKKLGVKRQEILTAARFDGVSLQEFQEESVSSSQSSVEDNQKRFDYSTLRPEWQTTRQVDRLERDLSELEKTLEETRLDDYEVPGAEERLIILKRNLKEVEARLKTEKSNESKLAQELKEVQESRSNAFIPFFDKIIAVIDNVCKKIYNNDSAQANLIAKNPDFPYLDGVQYDCIPPGKIYRTGDQLSGGEKAMAGLIFLFALQESRSPSLIILDEVDGALDPKFVRGFVNYLKILKMKHQIFIISHNPAINADADVIVAVAPLLSSGELKSVPIMVNLAEKFGD
uniref:Structural maintenance of chromosomes protein n=1 Tax=Fopius arisanus TaxID=64838 RepID=A0A0C9PGY2_9HYME